MKHQQRLFLEETIRRLNDLNQAHKRLLSLWQSDRDSSIDLNNYLADNFPYHLSLDELDVRKWVELGTDTITEAILFEVLDPTDEKVLEVVSEDEINGCLEKVNKVLLHDTGKQCVFWIFKHQETGKYSTVVGRGSEYGSLASCMKCIEKECDYKFQTVIF